MIHVGNCLDILPTLPAGSAQTCITSPPYFGLRNYDMPDQLGLEATSAEFVAALVAVFREVRRVLRDDGTLWLNLGDSYARNPAKGGSGEGGKNAAYLGDNYMRSAKDRRNAGANVGQRSAQLTRRNGAEVREKNLLGIPWRVAFALQDDGWYLRQDIIWSKPNPMPESVTDRCTKSHEYLFLLTKSSRYYFDAAAIAEPLAPSSVERLAQPLLAQQAGSDRVPGKTNGTMKAVGPRFGGNKYGDDEREESRNKSGNEWTGSDTGRRNKRSVWTIATQPTKEAHFATFPEALVEPCIRAGSKPGDTVLDPFLGSGTVGLVAEQEGRQWIGCELNPAYAAIAQRRVTGAQRPLLTDR